MSLYPPVGIFEWVQSFNMFNVKKGSKYSWKCYILEVDLGYPNELHNLHNDHCLRSDYCIEVTNKYHISVSSVKNLIKSLGVKKNTFVITETSNYIYS